MRIVKSIILFVVLIVLAGCLPNLPHKMPTSINENAKIGVFSLLGGNAVQLGSSNFLVSLLPNIQVVKMKTIYNFNYDEVIDSALSNSLKKYGFKDVNIIQSPGKNPFANLSLTAAGFVNFENDSINLIKKVTIPCSYDYIILVIPDYYQNTGAARTGVHFRYGVSFKNPPFGKPYFFAAYNVLIIDGKSYKGLVREHFEIIEDVNENIMAEQLTANSVSENAFKNWLRGEILNSIIHKTFSAINK